jgi:hypothetical protein
MGYSGFSFSSLGRWPGHEDRSNRKGCAQKLCPVHRSLIAMSGRRDKIAARRPETIFKLDPSGVGEGAKNGRILVNVSGK